MNKKFFTKEMYVRANGTINFPNLQSNAKLFVDTVWQRSAEENAKGFEFFASLWKTPGLKHKGVLEGKASKKKDEPKEESKEKVSTPKGKKEE